VLKSKRLMLGLGTVRAQAGGISGNPTASFVAYCLLSNADLPAKAFAAFLSGSSLPISISLDRRKLYNQNPSSLLISGCFLLIV
jgi:hypothetical protein